MNENVKVPIWERYTLTISEAAQYYNIGEKKLRKLIDEHYDADFIVMNGNKVLIKRKMFERFIDQATVL